MPRAPGFHSCKQSLSASTVSFPATQSLGPLHGGDERESEGDENDAERLIIVKRSG